MKFLNSKYYVEVKDHRYKIHPVDEVLLVIKFPQTKPLVKSLNIKYYDVYCTVCKNRVDKEIVNNKHENNEKDYISLNDFVTDIQYIGRKNNIEILK